MKHIFIINPVAGKGKGLDFERKIHNIFKELNYHYKIIVTKKSGHAIEEVKKITSKEKCIVYSIGGDGTLNEVLNGIINSGSSLAVIPAGSGNDFARTLYGDIKSDNLLEDLIHGEERTIDVAKLNDKYYLNISSIGFDASVVNNARYYKKYKFISGPMAYAIAVIKTLFTFKPMELTFKIDGEETKGNMYLIAVANGKCYGGGIKIAPKAKLDDGLLDIYAIKKPKVHRLIRFLPMVVSGKDTSRIDEIKYIKCSKIQVIAKKETIINLDGEILFSKDLTFEVIPSVLKVRVPKKDIIKEV